MVVGVDGVANKGRVGVVVEEVLTEAFLLHPLQLPHVICPILSVSSPTLWPFFTTCIFRPRSFPLDIRLQKIDRANQISCLAQELCHSF